ncbi:UNVERIFIED_ORG: hypothetical protein ABIC54_004600 [Burkholderia sp. 1263]
MTTDMDLSNEFRFPVPASSTPRRDDWPFYLDRRKRAWLRCMRDAWGEEAVIQIYAGCVRIQSENCDWRFSSEAELRAATLQRRCERPRGRPPVKNKITWE